MKRITDGNHKMIDAPENTEITLNSAQKAIDRDRQERRKAFGEELERLLEKYKCSLHTHQEWIDGQPKSPSQIIIVAQ